MRQKSAYIALIGGIASIAGVSTASAGCGCAMPLDVTIPPYAAAVPHIEHPILVPQPVLVAEPIPQPIYVVNQGTYPYVHGFEFYARPHYYGVSHGWRYARHLGYFARPRHFYGPLEK